jgi:hypothetical protein
MAIYKIFPTKDTTIYSAYPNLNSGLDPLLEMSTTTVTTSGISPQVARTLIQFDTTEINDIVSNKISGSLFSTYLKIFQAQIFGLYGDSSIEVYPLYNPWNMGTGQYSNNPISTNGASWTWSDFSGSNTWTTGGFPNFVTASYPSTNLGGGTWYTGSSNSTVLPIYSTQSFSYYSNLDLELNVTNIIKAWNSGSITNNGFILKQPNSKEFLDTNQSQTELKYYSRDTNTIYPPILEFRWRDYTFNTGSSINTIINTDQLAISNPNNLKAFYSGSIQRFRLNVRPQYPVRIFQTASLYTTNYYLPTASYYAIKDLQTNEYVINFDTNYTQISADNQSSYFDIYMSGLQPERYYTVLIKTTISGSTIIYDQNINFKVING